MAVRVCPNCAKPLPAGAWYCAQCNYVLAVSDLSAPKPAPDVRCPHCGASNRPHTYFCARCGKSFSEPAEIRRAKHTNCLVISIVAMTLMTVGLCVCVGLVYTLAWDDLIAGLDDPNDAPAATLAPGATPGTGIKVGQIAPDFSLRDSAGNTIRLFGLRGRPVIVNFWASWCGPCRNEMPDLNALYKDNAGARNLYVLAVNTGDSNRSAAETFIRDKGLAFTVVWDEGSRVGKQYRVNAIPMTYFIDRTGVIRAISTGSLSRSAMDERARLIYP